MRYITIPDTALECSAICMGTMGMGSWADEETSFALLDHYAEAGGNFLDSARIYGAWAPQGAGASEKMVGKWMKARGNRDKIIIGTKGGHPDLATRNIPRLSREELTFDLEESLRSLQTDRIDLYWLHRDDTARPVGEILETLASFIKQGKIRYIGCSNWTAPRIAEALDFAAANGIPGFAANQPRWNLASWGLPQEPSRQVPMDEELYRLHRERGFCACPYSPQAGGFFTKLDRGEEFLRPHARKNYLCPENVRRLETAREIAAHHSTTVTAVTLAWLTSQPFLTIPIVGCRRLEQIDDSLAAADVVLSAEEVEALGAVE